MTYLQRERSNLQSMNTNLPTPTSNTSSIDHSQQKAPAVKKRRTNVKKEKATNYMTPGSMSVVNSNRGVSLPASAPGVLGVPGNKVPQTQTSSPRGGILSYPNINHCSNLRRNRQHKLGLVLDN